MSFLKRLYSRWFFNPKVERGFSLSLVGRVNYRERGFEEPEITGEMIQFLKNDARKWLPRGVCFYIIESFPVDVGRKRMVAWYYGPKVNEGVTGSWPIRWRSRPRPTSTRLVEPDELYDRLSAFLLGNRIAGKEVKAVADVTVRGDAYAAKGRMTAPELVVTLAPEPLAPGTPPDPMPTVIAQRDLVAEFDLLADLGAEHIEIRKCSYASRSARGTVEGRTDGSGAKMAANVTIRAKADLAQVRNDFGSMMPANYELRGRASAKFDVAGRGRITITGGATHDCLDA